MARKTNRPTVKKSSSHRPRGVSQKAFNKVYWPYIPIIAITVFGFVFSNIAQVASASRNRSNVLAYATSMSISGLLSSTNTQRSANGVASLSLNTKLNAAAQAKANDMASRNYWSHNTPEGNPPWIFVNAQGYAYQKIGENLATGFSTENATISGWMNSPSHKANMLDPAFSEAGFGFANNANYTAAGGGPQTIVVAFYGAPVYTPPPSCPAGQVGTPPNCATPVAPAVEQNSTPAVPTQQPEAQQPATTEDQPPKQRDDVTPVENEEPKEERQEAVAQPVNTDNGTPATPISTPTNQLGIMVSGTAAQWLTGFSLVAMGAAAFFWVAHHAVQLRRFVVAGEDFVVHHPIIDVVVVTIIAVTYTLTQTVGFIQ